uniref:PB1 domain-containing protein n=1 Tax=Elaeophora elaphi TaxID=1147741 RepID=A0A0R3S5W3_9BILA
MKHNGGDLKVKWNHHGHKYKFILTKQELAQEDVFEILLRKIRRQLPDFNDVLVSYDKHGSESIVATDNEFRQLVLAGKGHLKMYTVRRCLHTHPFQSYSIPLDIARLKRLPLRSNSCLRGPPPSYRESQKDAMRQIHNSYHSLPRWGIAPLYYVPSSSFGYACAHYETAISTGTCSTRYGQSLIYGYPPQSSMMHSFLCSPFPFGGHYRSWICGPKCLTLSLGGKSNRPKCTSWWNTIL